MPIALQELVDEILPERTILILGAGSSVPSGAPTGADLIAAISDHFKINSDGLSLREIAGLAEKKRNRRELISTVRAKVLGLRPKGAILNVPLYSWKSLYTTNYDNLVEDAYQRASRLVKAYSSNFDFTADELPDAAKLFMNRPGFGGGSNS